MTAAEREEQLRKDAARERLMNHNCRESGEPSWWERDARGIELCRVCDICREAKLSRYRPEILSGYDQDDVNEPIEAE